MRTVPHERDYYHWLSIGVAVVVALASIGLGILLGRSKDAEIRRNLRESSQTIAAALEPSQILQMKGEPKDADLQVYKKLKIKLAGIKRANHAVRSIYLTGQHDGRLFFYVDSEQPDSDQYSPAAEWYDDATPEFKGIFKTGETVVEGPVADDFGTFISGLAPIFNGEKVIAVIGIDVDASTYWRDIFSAGALPIASGLVLIMVIVIFESIRRRNMQLLALRSELVSVASHELRNPVTGIRWAAESLEKLVGDQKALPLIGAIKNSAIRLQASTDDILELSHAMSRRALNLVPTDMTALVQEILDTQALSAQQKDITLHMGYDWPSNLTLTCDPYQIKRALHNVVSNSIKYSGDHTAVTVTYTQDEQLHHIGVVDQGMGIPVAEQDKVFRGFYRASNAVASKVPGTGLGLYLVKAVLEQHGGSVSCVSVENTGTTVTLNLPKKLKS